MEDLIDNLDESPKKSETPKPKRKPTLKKPAGKDRRSTVRRNTIPLPQDAKAPFQQSEPVVDPLKIITMSGPMESLKEDADLDEEFNHIENDNKSAKPFENDLTKQFPKELISEETVFVPQVRKVALKKISRFNFRLGMEKTPEKYNLVPGTGHGWMCDKRGDQFITGLDKRPEDKLRLERALRVDLGNTSPFWSTLTFSMEDKDHGQIMNFDDVQMGALYEVIYFAMLESSMIANGLQEYSSGKKPFAEWYIENKEAEAEAKEVNMTHDIEATEKFTALSFSRRTGIAKMLGLKAWGVSDKVAGQELWDFIRKDTNNANEFLKLARMRDDEFSVSVLIKDAIKLSVLRRNKANDLTYANETLGPTEDHVVSKLIQPNNANLRLAIERMVEAKKS